MELTTSKPVSSYQTAPPAFVLQGDFFNNSPYELKKVRLTFVLFNPNVQIIGVSQRDESTIKPFERRAYKQLWPNSAVPELGKIDVTADTNTLDENNLTVSSAPSDGAGNLGRP